MSTTKAKDIYIADGTTQIFALTFPFISRTHISVSVAGVDATFSFNNDSQIVIASPTVVNNNKVIIKRTTSDTVRLVDYVDGSNLTEADLDLDSKQAFFMAQEALDETITVDFSELDDFSDTATASVSGDILVTDGTEFTNKTLSGDATIASTGALTVANDAITTAKILNDNVTTAKILDDNVTTAKILDLNVTTGKLANDAVTPAKSSFIDDTLAATDTHIMVADGTDFDNVAVSGDATLANTGALTIANDAVTTAKILNSNVTLAKIVSASATNKLLGRVSSGGGVFEEVSVETTLSSTDEAIPTSKAVRDDIVSLINDVGGFVAVATEVAFPNTNPDPDDGAGTVVSIANVGGLVVDGSGVSTTGRTLGGSTVTINSISSTYYSSTIADGLGMQVVSTAVLNTYNYHKIIAKEGDTNIVATNIANVNLAAGNNTNITTVAGQISPTNNISTLATNNTNITNVGGSIANVNTVAGANANISTIVANVADINRYAEEYTIASSAPGSPSEGDLWYDSTANVLKVHNGSSFVAVTSATAGITSVADDTTPQLGGFLDANGNYIQMQKGGDIASASPIVIDTDGDYFICTGTNNFSAMTVAADRHFFLEFSAVLTMTHGAGTIDLPSGANIITAAGDVGEFVSTAADVVTCVNYSRASGKPIVTNFVDADILDLAATKLTGTVATARLGTGTADSTKFLRGDNTWQVVAVPKLDLPTITGTLSVLSGGSVTHTITNLSDDIAYTITPTNCTVGSINASGEFVVTQTSGLPSYTIVATTASLGLDNSDTLTKNIALQLTAPTISSPADSYEAVNVTYTITSTTADDDKLILNMGSSNFTYQSVSHGSGSKVGNTVEVTGFTTNNPAVIIQYTAEATYSVTATSVKIDGTFTTSPASSADSITILNPTLSAPTISSPADSSEAVNVTYTITSNDANDNKLILNIGSSNFTYQSVSVGTASKVGNTVECVGFTTNNPAVIIQFTAEATYSVTATAVDTAAYYHTSVASSADSITILNPTLTAPAISSPADVGTLTNAAYTITSNDANDNKLILDIGSSNFNFGSVSVGSASKVGNTVECTGFTTNNPVVTIQFTAEATYSVTAKATDTAAYYHDSVNSSADSITILNFTGMAATGGSVTTSGDYKIHTFTASSTTFNITTAGTLPQVEYLVVAGGGGGGNSAGGGGAGGFRTATGLAVTQTSYTVSVGGGGAGNASGAGNGVAGTNSSFHTITSTGGGYGGGYGGPVGGTGGSAGGNSTNTGASTAGNAGGYSPVEGYGGGRGDSGGGGGAGGIGDNGVYASGLGGTITAAGGVGRSSSISGSSVYYAGGGAGFNGTGGNGGGGNGGGVYNSPPATVGAVNTGGGGGGGGQGGGYSPSAAGGSGIVIIKYKFQ
jgi:hypothetical protein